MKKILREINIAKNQPEIILEKIIEFDYLYYLFFGEEKISKFKKVFIF